jgi:TolA-binding protein
MNKIFSPSFFAFFLFGIFLTIPVEGRQIASDEQLIRVGVGAYNDGFDDIAESQFAQFVKEYPAHENIHGISYLLGKTFLKKGKMKEAKRLFTKILNEGKNFEFLDYTLFWAAETEMRLGNGEESRRLLLSLIKRFPKFEWIDYAHFHLGLLDLEANRLIPAETSLKKVLFLSKRNDIIRPAWFWLGVLSYRHKDYEPAARYFRMIWEDPRFVSQTYLRYALFWLGESQMKSGRFGDARSTCKTFCERFKGDPLTVQVYWRLGYCEYRLGNNPESVEILRSFSKESKDAHLLSLTQYLLGEIFLSQGDFPSSMKELNPLLAQEQGNALWGAGALALFWNYVQLAEKDGASKIFQKLQKLNHFEDEKLFIQWLNAEIAFFEGRISDALPYYFNVINSKHREKALLQIGRGYFFENKFREAVTNFDILLLEFPSSNAADESLFLKGECLARMGDLEEALEAYQLLTKGNGISHWRLFALTQMGTLHQLRGEKEKSEEVFKRAIREFPDHPLFYHAALQLANVSFRKKEIVEAMYYYSIVLKADTLELLGQAYFALGEIFYQQGKHEKAFKNFETAVSYLKESSPWFFLSQLEIGNLQRKWERYEEARKSYGIVLDRSDDEEIKRAAKELLSHIERY